MNARRGTRGPARLAVIDCGSNSFRLVVFTHTDTWWKRTDEVHEPVRVGEGLEGSGALQPEPMERALETLELYAHFCAATGIDAIRAVATSAIRDATNQAEFLAAALARDGGDEAALLHAPLLDGELAPRLEAQVRELAEGLVEVVADVRRGDLVGRDVVAQASAELRGELDVLALELAPDELRVVDQEEDAALEPDLRRELLDLALEERGDHRRCAWVKSGVKRPAPRAPWRAPAPAAFRLTRAMQKWGGAASPATRAHDRGYPAARRAFAHSRA
ncbi:MAG TPA: hypothetical protein VHG91_05310 [Longimicrobium sp.]|nr:hypothetical protein [Longimicrobium sp.]